MKIILNTASFLEWINDNSMSDDHFIKTRYSVGADILKIKNIEFLDIDLSDKNFESTRFEQCLFKECKFDQTIFYAIDFEDCLFESCTFTSSKFIDTDMIGCQFENCKIYDFELADIKSKKVSFNNCSEILDLRIRPCRGREFLFRSCYIAFLDIEPNKSEEQDKIDFYDCLIKECSFDRIDFSVSEFKGCSLSLNQFSDCLFAANTLIHENETPANEFNLIDIRTIINSSDLTPTVFAKIFGIHNADVKDYLIGLTTKIEFQSIFISYSFADRRFAEIINEALLRRGILTFLWEKDAPGGLALKEIMKKGVREKDRVLFIASKNSLKSEACHYELTQGRKKQEKTWEDVLFPIHIDSYLFEITKDKIRPKEIQDEYWSNIEELRSMHSIDFSKFDNDNLINNIEFEKSIFNLIKGLRKKK